MKVLVGCEKSGNVRDAFLQAGHDAWSCDLQPSDRPGPHYQQDVLEVIPLGWDLIILFPECTKLCVSGNHVYAKGKEKHHERLQAIEWTFALWLLSCLCSPRVALENPVGVLPTATSMPRPQYIQPYEYGHNASKATGLFLHNLPKLVATCRIKGRKVVWRGREVERWDNQTDSGQNKLGPSLRRAEIRGTTYPGVATAMAKQWGAL